MRWGLVPGYTAGKPPDYWKMFNARSETLAASPVFSKLLRDRRCAVPFDGFFEWVDDECKTVKSKQPYYVKHTNGQALWMAGLYESCALPTSVLDSQQSVVKAEAEKRTDATAETFTIVTRDVDPQLSWLHDRMPVILDKEGVQAWLDPSSTRPLEALSHRLSTDELCW